VTMRCSGGGTSRRFSAALRSDRARVFRWDYGNAANFVVRASAPTFPFIVALRDGGPHAIGLAVRPRSGRVTFSGSVHPGRDQTNKKDLGAVTDNDFPDWLG
jgi:hypothetical protein